MTRRIESLSARWDTRSPTGQLSWDDKAAGHRGSSSFYLGEQLVGFQINQGFQASNMGNTSNPGATMWVLVLPERELPLVKTDSMDGLGNSALKVAVIEETLARLTTVEREFLRWLVVSNMDKQLKTVLKWYYAPKPTEHSDPGLLCGTQATTKLGKLLEPALRWADQKHVIDHELPRTWFGVPWATSMTMTVTRQTGKEWATARRLAEAEVARERPPDRPVRRRTMLP